MKIHIGKEIEKKVQERGLKIPFFADKIATGERNVYSIFKRDDISAEMLIKISKVLNFNFFSLYEFQSPPKVYPENGLQSSRTGEPEQEFGFVNMSISFNISAPVDRIEEITEFISLVNHEAVKKGFKIK